MDDHQRPGPTVTLEDARAQLLSSLRPLPPHAVALDEALGRVLGQPVVAPEDVPRFANAAMDGYALRAEDTDRVPARLRLVGTITAGTVADVVLQKGQVIAITTGAPVPEGADAVCMVEHTRLEAGKIVIGTPVAPGENVRWPGEDIPRGSTVFEAGTVLAPAHLGGWQAWDSRKSRPFRGHVSACCRPAASWSMGRRRCSRGRSATRTVTACWRSHALGGLRERRSRTRRGRRGVDHPGAGARRGALRRHRDLGRRERRRCRPHEDGARAARRRLAALDGNPYPPGQAVRLRHADRLRGPGAVPAGEPRPRRW